MKAIRTRTIITLGCIASFIWLTVLGRIDPRYLITIVEALIFFYLGEKSGKKKSEKTNS